MTPHLDARAPGRLLAAAGCALGLSTGEATALGSPAEPSAPAPPASGGAPAPSPAQTGAAPPPPRAAAPGDERVRARYSPRALLVGHLVRVSGRLPAAPSGQAVLLQLRRGGRWRTVARVRTTAGGRFTARWRPKAAGTARLRVRAAHRRPGASSTRAVSGTVIVYRRARASWYGPGLYGRRLACGGRLRRGRIGVAHRTLACGTRVRLRYRGRSLVAPVIDRGPYVGGREWDLTEATRERLAFPSTGFVWADR